MLFYSQTEKRFGQKFANKTKARSFRENRAVYEIVWENIVEPDRPQMTI